MYKKSCLFTPFLISLLICSCNGQNSNEQNIELHLGDSFVFNNFNIQFASLYSIAKYDDELSSEYDYPFIRIQAKIKNISSEPAEFYTYLYKFYGPENTEIYSSARFDDSIDNLGIFKSGETIECGFYIKYIDDGEYRVSFNRMFNNIYLLTFDVTGGDDVLPSQTHFFIGDSFYHDGFDYSFKDNYQIILCDKQNTSYYGKSIIKLPVIVTNKKEYAQNLSISFYKLYDTNKNYISSCGFLYKENSVDTDEAFEPNKQITKYFYIPFIDNGEYTIEFSRYWFVNAKILTFKVIK